MRQSWNEHKDTVWLLRWRAGGGTAQQYVREHEKGEVMQWHLFMAGMRAEPSGRFWAAFRCGRSAARGLRRCGNECRLMADSHLQFGRTAGVCVPASTCSVSFEAAGQRDGECGLADAFAGTPTLAHLHMPLVPQQVELQASKVVHVGLVDAGAYPLAKKKTSYEFLREKAHLRPRTNTIGAVARIRNALAYATHRFFQVRFRKSAVVRGMLKGHVHASASHSHHSLDCVVLGQTLHFMSSALPWSVLCSFLVTNVPTPVSYTRRKKASCMCTHPSSPPAMPRAPARCSRCDSSPVQQSRRALASPVGRLFL